MKKIEIYDTTLRDGAQSEGINFSASDKLKIIQKLDELGVDYIEAGWPGANPKDVEVFREVKNLNLQHSTIAAFGSTKKPTIKVEDDVVLKMLLEAETDIVTIFGKTWDFHVIHALGTTLDENLKMIFESVDYLRKCGRRVFFDCEHFFDGYKANPEYATEAVQQAINAGAERIIFCDTNGGNINTEIYKVSHAMVQKFPDVKFGIHAHNDSDMAVANSVAAVDAGCIQVQGCINGFGERTGNANLCSIIPNLQIKKDYDAVGENIVKLVYVAKTIGEIANIALPSSAPFVGASAFAHKAGVHASGVRKNSKTYEHISPEVVGNVRKIVISDQSGTASIREKLKDLRIVKEIDENVIPQIIEKIKKLEWKGFAFEGAEASFELLVADILKRKPNFFEVINLRIIGDQFSDKEKLNTEASIKVKVGEDILHVVSEGDGPVNALDTALRKALAGFYPQIEKFKLSDFKVRILDSENGTGAIVRVNVETTDGFNKWDTVGVNTNIINASYAAIVDSINYGLML